MSLILILTVIVRVTISVVTAGAHRADETWLSGGGLGSRSRGEHRDYPPRGDIRVPRGHPCWPHRPPVQAPYTGIHTVSNRPAGGIIIIKNCRQCKAAGFISPKTVLERLKFNRVRLVDKPTLVTQQTE